MVQFVKNICMIFCPSGGYEASDLLSIALASVC